MILSSSRAVHDVPVSIFSYDGQRKFLRVHESYNDMLDGVASGFSIRNPEAIRLSTSTLEACRGSDIVIERSAYPLLCPFLNEVNVTLLNNNPPEHQILYREVSVVSRRSPTPGPIECPVAAAAPCGLFAAPEAGTSRAPSEVNQSLPDEYPTPAPTSASESQKEVEEVANQALAPHHADNLFSLEVEQDVRREEERMFEEPEYEFEEDIHEDRPPTPPTPSPPRAPKRFKPALGSVIPELEGLRIKKEKTKEITEAVETPTTPSEVPQSAVTASKRDTPRHNPGVDVDSRFELTIKGPGPNMLAQFKLRGKNSVRKVLAAACKNFELDFERARLVQLVETEEDGEYFLDEIVCSPEETMASCGINVGSRLTIKVDSFSEEEDYVRARLASDD